MSLIPAGEEPSIKKPLIPAQNQAAGPGVSRLGEESEQPFKARILPMTSMAIVPRAARHISLELIN